MMSLNCLMVVIQCQIFKIISSISKKCEALTINAPKTRKRENVPSLEVVEVVLVQCNLVNNQY